MRKWLLLFTLLPLPGCSQDPEEAASSSLPAITVPPGDVMDDETMLRLSSDIAKNPQDDLAYRRRGDEFYHRGQYDKAAVPFFIQAMGTTILSPRRPAPWRQTPAST